MKNVNELKQERASKIKAQQDLTNLVKAENRNFTEDEGKKFDGLTTEIDAIDIDMKRAIQIAENEKRMAAVAGAPVGEPKKEEPKQERFTFLNAITNVLNQRGLTPEQEKINEAATAELRASGLSVSGNASFSIPSTMMRAQSVLNDSGTKGGALVPTDISFVQPLEPKLTVEGLGANVLSGLTGDVKLPSSGSFTLSYVAEGAAVTGTDVTFSGPTMKPKRLAGVVDISKKLLMQGSIDVENYIRARLANAVNVAVLKNAISGPGTNAPTGLYDLITTNIDTTATGLTWNIAVGLETLIKSSDATELSLGYLSDTALMGSAKTIKKDAGSGIFLYDNGNMNGQRYVASSVISTLDTGVSHPLIFGDWSQMFVGFWGGMSFTIDPYTQAASGNVRIIVEIYNDIAVTNEKAFAIANKLTV